MTSNDFASRHHHGDNLDCGYCKDIREQFATLRSTITRLEQERDRYKLLYDKSPNCDDLRADNAALRSTITRLEQALRPLAEATYTFKAYPQGLAGQDPLCGVKREDIHVLRDLAFAALRALKPQTPDPQTGDKNSEGESK